MASNDEDDESDDDDKDNLRSGHRSVLIGVLNFVNHSNVASIKSDHVSNDL